jgi:hypothetical protein
MRPGLFGESQSDAATTQAVANFRDMLVAEGHDSQAIGVAMIAVPCSWA